MQEQQINHLDPMQNESNNQINADGIKENRQSPRGYA
mgnify:CR=1 FL=1